MNENNKEISPPLFAVLQTAIDRGLADRTPVGIPAIDDAIPYLQGRAVWPENLELSRDNPDRWTDGVRYVFLGAMQYFMLERPDSLELSERRRGPVAEAVQHIKEAAKLLDMADNEPLSILLLSIADCAKDAQYGTVTPQRLYRGHLVPPAWLDAWEKSQFTPGRSASEPENWQELLHAGLKTKQGMLLDADMTPDAASGMFTGKRGRKARDANIVKGIARYFPDSPDFLGRQNGYAVIAQLAMLCGMTGASAKRTSADYVRSILNGGPKSNKEPQKQDALSLMPKPQEKPAIP